MKKKTLNRYVLTDEIYTILKERIINRDLPPGEKVNIDLMARELEVSNIPIREALSRLASEGFVKIIPFKGMFVLQLDVAEIDDIFELRSVLEPHAVRKACSQIPISELNQLRRQMEELQQEITARTESQLLENLSSMNEGLHGLILRYCSNESLKLIIISYIERIERYLSLMVNELELSTLEMEWQEHNRVIDALLDRDSERAANAMQEHLTSSHERTRQFFLSRT